MAPRNKKEVEIVVFKDPAKEGRLKKLQREGLKKQVDKKSDQPSSSKPNKAFDYRNFKYDVRKLGIHGMNLKDKETAMQDFLIELGAKPPKNPCYHIQEYQKLKKQKQEEEKRVDALEIMAGIKKKTKVKRKQTKDDILSHVDGQIGFYKKGVQFIKRTKR